MRDGGGNTADTLPYEVGEKTFGKVVENITCSFIPCVGLVATTALPPKHGVVFEVYSIEIYIVGFHLPARSSGNNAGINKESQKKSSIFVLKKGNDPPFSMIFAQS